MTATITRLSELTIAEQKQITALVNHLASFSPDSSERLKILALIESATSFNPFVQ